MKHRHHEIEESPKRRKVLDQLRSASLAQQSEVFNSNEHRIKDSLDPINVEKTRNYNSTEISQCDGKHNSFQSVKKSIAIPPTQSVSIGL